ARLADLEFMQFHPTALVPGANDKGASLPLLTEALRGAGALLLDQSGRRFMLEEHAAAELAPRDVVARAIQRRMLSGDALFLDVRPLVASGKASSFPQALGAAREAGFDPATEPLPIAPAAHYHMGGVQTDQFGRTSLKGLWACGEVATTGVHGANRLASNSLLEGLVYARRVAEDVGRISSRRNATRHRLPPVPTIATSPDGPSLESLLSATRMTMSDNVGISRSAAGLESALSKLSNIDSQLPTSSRTGGRKPVLSAEAIIRCSEVRNVVLVARLVTLAASRRKESRGAHYRADYPVASPKWRRRQNMTIDSLREDLAEIHA
ncbi:MAG TPA: FAD-binding protein, partial [Woeseiaceae bacterium]|nr:FAD-binding protein [Woeseiaceae bacterium]